MNDDLYCCKYCRFHRPPECHKNPPPWSAVIPGDWCGCFDFSKEAQMILDDRQVKASKNDTAEMIRKYKEKL